ncbi:MAG: type I methionyl aminopeptidase [Candidatus Aminicenantes bacterium]|nr:type I methionyl aminopeptidase [Candidatus Aminicenantes bacterium]
MIIYKSEEEIKGIKRSNQIVAKILDELSSMIKPGVQTKDLDEHAEKRARDMGAVPAFKGYRGYPSSLCTSINEEIVHGLPSSRTLREGDIISLDFGILCDGFYGDAAETYPVGNISPIAKKLITAAENAFYKGIEKIREGNRISDISNAIQTYVEAQGFSIIRSFVGHGIGLSLHEEPQVPNFGLSGRGPKIRKGLVLAIEPMIAVGDWRMEVLADKWTAVTIDRSLSAHYEHTVALTERGLEILSVLDDKEPNFQYLKRNQHA